MTCFTPLSASCDPRGVITAQERDARGAGPVRQERYNFHRNDAEKRDSCLELNMEISRRGFVRDTLGTAAALAGLAGTDAKANAAADTEDDYYRRLVKANDASLPSVFEQLQGSPEGFGARGVGEA